MGSLSAYNKQGTHKQLTNKSTDQPTNQQGKVCLLFPQHWMFNWMFKKTWTIWIVCAHSVCLHVTHEEQIIFTTYYCRKPTNSNGFTYFSCYFTWTCELVNVALVCLIHSGEFLYFDSYKWTDTLIQVHKSFCPFQVPFSRSSMFFFLAEYSSARLFV